MAKTAKQLAEELHEKCAKEKYVLSAACVSPDNGDVEMVMCNGHGAEILAAICLQIQHLSELSGVKERKLLDRIEFALKHDKEF